jgi:3-methyl-2-oxobutanoate hydroxymethyltransferase
MLPQHIVEEGGKYRIKGRDDAGRAKLLADAGALADAGVFIIVLEIVIPPVAKEITRAVSVPTIGIGSGPDCDGQILVTPDLIGMFPWFTPRFVQPRANWAAEIKAAVAGWKQSITGI